LGIGEMGIWQNGKYYLAKWELVKWEDTVNLCWCIPNHDGFSLYPQEVNLSLLFSMEEMGGNLGNSTKFPHLIAGN
jgi:hypothetical protein